MEDIYEVECVLDIRRTKRGNRYLIKWKNFNSPSWEPEENIVDCQEAIDLFYAKKAHEDEIKKEQLKTPKNQTSVRKPKSKKEVTKSQIKSTTSKATITQETEIRPTPLTRRSLRLSSKNLNTATTEPEKQLPKNTSSKICSDTKKCPVKYFFYIFCLIMIFMIVFMSLPQLTDDNSVLMDS